MTRSSTADQDAGTADDRLVRFGTVPATHRHLAEKVQAANMSAPPLPVQAKLRRLATAYRATRWARPARLTLTAAIRPWIAALARDPLQDPDTVPELVLRVCLPLVSPRLERVALKVQLSPPSARLKITMPAGDTAAPSIEPSLTLNNWPLMVTR